MMKMEGDKNTLAAESDEDHNKKGRSYDCSFCKRGFTNAQALGGHMNIHRKDKAKTKPNQDSLSSTFFHHQIAAADYHQGRHVNYQVYMPPPNPGLQTGNYEYCFFPVWRPDQNLQDRVDGDLNLTIGAVEEDGEQEVDLELRLGRLF